MNYNLMYHADNNNTNLFGEYTERIRFLQTDTKHIIIILLQRLTPMYNVVRNVC